jgi:hypothetical protein
MSDIEARRAANRAAFPEVARIVDEFRAAFRIVKLDDKGKQVVVDTITVQYGEEGESHSEEWLSGHE